MRACRSICDVMPAEAEHRIGLCSSYCRTMGDSGHWSNVSGLEGVETAGTRRLSIEPVRLLQCKAISGWSTGDTACGQRYCCQTPPCLTLESRIGDGEIDVASRLLSIRLADNQGTNRLSRNKSGNSTDQQRWVCPVFHGQSSGWVSEP